MSLRSRVHHRSLAIDPTPKGFGFALMENNELIDWGSVQVTSDKNIAVLKRSAQLLRRFRPDRLVLENHAAVGSRRRTRIQQLLARIAALATANKIHVVLVSAKALRSTFRQFGARNKDQIAAKIVEWFPELAPRLPKPRKPWMSEDERMGIFDAVALTITLFGRGARDRSQKQSKTDSSPTLPTGHHGSACLTLSKKHSES